MTVTEAKEVLLEVGPRCGHEPVDLVDMSRLGLAAGVIWCELERLEAEVAALRKPDEAPAITAPILIEKLNIWNRDHPKHLVATESDRSWADRELGNAIRQNHRGKQK